MERLALRTALRLERAIAIYCVIAWRLMVLRYWGEPCQSWTRRCSSRSWKLRFLKGYASRVKLPRPGTLQEAILLVAVLGGVPESHSRRPPGHQIMWRGLERWRWPHWGTRSGTSSNGGPALR